MPVLSSDEKIFFFLCPNINTYSTNIWVLSLSHCLLQESVETLAGCNFSSPFPNWIKHSSLISFALFFANINIDFFPLLHIFLPAVAIIIFYLIFFFQDDDSESEDCINHPHASCFISYYEKSSLALQGANYLLQVLSWKSSLRKIISLNSSLWLVNLKPSWYHWFLNLLLVLYYIISLLFPFVRDSNSLRYWKAFRHKLPKSVKCSS